MTDERDSDRDVERDTPGVSRELATVTRLPARRDDRDGEVVEAEVVSEQEYLARQRWASYRQDVVTVARVTKAAVTHRRVVPVWRHGAYVFIGASELTKRWAGSGPVATAKREYRVAQAEGDRVRSAEWFDRLEAAKKARHERLKDWARAPAAALKLGGITLFGLIALLLLVGCMYAYVTGEWRDIGTPLYGVFLLIAGLVWFVTVTAVFAPPLAGALVAYVCWGVGRHHDEKLPEVIAPATVKRDMDTITASRALAAFRGLGIAELRKKILELGPDAESLVGLISHAGCGVEFDFTLPREVTSTDEVLSRHARLAENLPRHKHEVHLSVPAPGVIRVWAAHPGALDEPVGTSPMLLDETLRIDYRRGRVPWGVSLRGDLVEIGLYQRHLLITGMSNQGKTRAMLALALGQAHHERTELWICDLKGINPDTKVSDWEPLRGLATKGRFIVGPTDEHVIAATEMLEDAVREMNRRIIEGGEWDPLTVWVDEAQVAYMCPAKDGAGQPYGGAKNTGRFLTAVRQIQNQGRAVDVLLRQGTQDPTAQNLPPLARDGAQLRMCLVVGKAEKSRMALGDQAAERGAAPHLLRPGLDKGVVVVAGDGAPVEQEGQASITVRTFYLPDSQVRTIADRLIARRGPQREWKPGERDLLADVADVLGPDEQVKAPDVAARLRELAPGYGPYERLHGKRLAELLEGEGVAVKKLDGDQMVRRDRVYAALDARDDEDGARE